MGTIFSAVTMKKIKSRLPILMASQNPPINQLNLAKATGLSATTINKIYNNKFVRIENESIETLCDYFQCDINDLLNLI